MSATRRAIWRLLLGISLALLLVCSAPFGDVTAQPKGQITQAIHFTIAPTYFDPAETISITSFLFLYALHDALVKPMPGNPMTPSLAESWSESEDGLTYEFKLRQGSLSTTATRSLPRMCNLASNATAVRVQSSSRKKSSRSRQSIPTWCASTCKSPGPIS